MDFLTSSDASFIYTSGNYLRGGDLSGLRAPWYLTGPSWKSAQTSACTNDATRTGGNQNDGIEHTPDVLWGCIVAAWAKRRLSLDTTLIDSHIADYKLSVTKMLDIWTYTNAGVPSFKADPERKPLWWFHHGSASWFENN